MRAILPIAVIALSLATSPLLAAQITQNLSAVETAGDFIPFDINGSGFNSTLGTLVSVTGQLTGVVTASSFIPLSLMVLQFF